MLCFDVYNNYTQLTCDIVLSVLLNSEEERERAMSVSRDGTGEVTFFLLFNVCTTHYGDIRQSLRY